MRATTVFFSTLFFVSLLACGGGGETNAGSTRVEPDPITVVTARAASGSMPKRIQLVGSVVARRQAQVAADANGVVIDTRAERGQTVRKGDPLVVVDTRTGRYNVDASIAQAAAQRAQSEAAEKECQRAEGLFAQGVISTAQIERTRAQCEAQRAVSRAAGASASAAQQVSRAVVRAPFDGIIGERMVELGGFVGSASPVATVYASGPLRLKVAIPEAEIGRVQVGSRVAVLVEEAVSGADVTTRKVTGTVSLVSGALREMTRDLVIEADLDAEDPALRPGMFVRAEVDVGEAGAVVVPSAALHQEGTITRVYVVREGRALEQVVRVGVEQDGKVAILAGVSPEDEVVLTPPDGLRDGQRVTTTTTGG